MAVDDGVVVEARVLRLREGFEDPGGALTEESCRVAREPVRAGGALRAVRAGFAPGDAGAAVARGVRVEASAASAQALSRHDGNERLALAARGVRDCARVCYAPEVSSLDIP